MAYERTSVITNKDTATRADSLDAFVASLGKMLKTQMAVRNADDEINFTEQVLAGNMTLANQLDYRKEQLKRISDDPEERKRVRAEISNLKDRVEQQAFTDKWAAQLSDFQGGLSSVESVISFLEQTKANTQDQAIINSVNQKIADMQQTKFSQTQELIKNSTNYAVNSQEVKVIDDQISKVQNYRNDAKLKGQDQLVSLYDLQIQSLNKAKNDAQIQKDVLQLGAVTATGGYGAVAMLDAINSKINGANTSGPVQVGGVTYATAKDFWLQKRDTYLSDSGSNGFFSSLSVDVKNDMAKKQSKNALNSNDVASLNKYFNTLGARSELRNYAAQIDLYKQDTMQDTANKLMTTIQNEFKRTLDVNKAVSTLSAVKNLGVNVDAAYTEILNTNASNKNQQVQGILSAAQQAMKNNPGLSPEQAVQTAVKAGAGTLISPTDAAGKSELDLATGAVKTAAAGKGVNDPRTTASALPGDGPGPGIFVIGATYQGKTAPSGQVYINKNGTVLLRPANNPTPELVTSPTATPGASTPGQPTNVNSPAPTSGIYVIGGNYQGKAAPAGQVYINKNGTVLLRPADNPTPELNDAPAPIQQNNSQPAAPKPSTPAPAPKPTPAPAPAKPKVNIKVIGGSYQGKKAPAGQVYVNKDGTILLRPSNNPTPELN
jgi:hypothetical protein